MVVKEPTTDVHTRRLVYHSADEKNFKKNSSLAAWALVVCGWGNVIASVIGPLAGVRGLFLGGGGWNSLVFLLFMVAVAAVVVAMGLVFRGALASYRAGP